MQQAALRAAGIEGDYRVVDVPPGELAGALRRLRAGEAAGANVTIPHKRAAALACDVLDADADACGAVNTLVVQDGRLLGANTDAAGFELALRHLGLWTADGPALVLGAGGAASAVVLALRRGGHAVALAARRDHAAASTAARLGVRSVAWVDVAQTAAGARLLVNATPAPLRDLPLDLSRLDARAVVCDLRYRPRPVDLVAAACAAGLRACDGVEMLLHQGMLSFRRWTGVEPPWEAARAALLAEVDG